MCTCSIVIAVCPATTSSKNENKWQTCPKKMTKNEIILPKNDKNDIF